MMILPPLFYLKINAQEEAKDGESTTTGKNSSLLGSVFQKESSKEKKVAAVFLIFGVLFSITTLGIMIFAKLSG